MVFKINIAEKTGKTFKLESEAQSLIGKELYGKVEGKEISPDLNGYEFEISGTSDKAGFTSMKEVEGVGLKKLFLTYGKAMKKRPRKEGKRKRSDNKPRGLRLRKTVRGKVISEDIIQINLKILKEGSKKLTEVFPDQNKAKDAPTEETPKEEKVAEKVSEPVKEEKKVEEKPKEEVKKEKPKTEEKSS